MSTSDVCLVGYNDLGWKSMQKTDIFAEDSMS